MVCCPQVSAIDSCIREPQGRGKCAKVRWRQLMRASVLDDSGRPSRALVTVGQYMCLLTAQVQEPMDNAQF